MEKVEPVRQHCDSHLSAFSSSDSSLELSTHPKESLGDIYTKPEQDSSSQTPQWSMMSTSPRAETGTPLFPDAFPQNLEPMKFPPSHIMDHPPGYDPNRIPKSIFSSKPTTPEWSTASNESLFSIQMGANSFSTDYSYLQHKLGEHKLGEAPEEWKNSTTNQYYAFEVKSNDAKSLSSPLPPLDNNGKNARALEGPGIQEKSVENPKMVQEEKSVNNNKQKTTNVVKEPAATTSNRPDDRVVPPTEASRISSPARTSSPCYSEASGNSSRSFAFPVLVNDGGKSNSLKGASEKLEKPQPQPQPEFQPEKQSEQKQLESQPKVAEKSWCSCFTCWPRCC